MKPAQTLFGALQGDHASITPEELAELADLIKRNPTPANIAKARKALAAGKPQASRKRTSRAPKASIRSTRMTPEEVGARRAGARHKRLITRIRTLRVRVAAEAAERDARENPKD